MHRNEFHSYWRSKYSKTMFRYWMNWQVDVSSMITIPINTWIYL